MSFEALRIALIVPPNKAAGSENVNPLTKAPTGTLPIFNKSFILFASQVY